MSIERRRQSEKERCNGNSLLGALLFYRTKWIPDIHTSELVNWRRIIIFAAWIGGDGGMDIYMERGETGTRR